MDAMVEPQSCAQCLIYLMAGNASDHTRAAEVLAVPKSLEVEQAAYWLHELACRASFEELESRMVRDRLESDVRGIGTQSEMEFH